MQIIADFLPYRKLLGMSHVIPLKHSKPKKIPDPDFDWESVRSEKQIQLKGAAKSLSFLVENDYFSVQFWGGSKPNFFVTYRSFVS